MYDRSVAESGHMRDRTGYARGGQKATANTAGNCYLGKQPEQSSQAGRNQGCSQKHVSQQPEPSLITTGWCGRDHSPSRTEGTRQRQRSATITKTKVNSKTYKTNT